MVACGNSRRIAAANGADGSNATTSMPARQASGCAVSHVATAAPDRPGTKPSSHPGRPVSRSTKDVIHGFDSRQPGRSPSAQVQRADRARVSSRPSIRTGAAGTSARPTAATTSARCTLHQDTPYSAATSDSARAERDAACSSRARNRAVSRHRGGTCADRSVNTRCAHRRSRQR